MTQLAIWSARGLCLAYWGVLSLLIVAPDPWAIFGIVRPAGGAAHRGAHFAAFCVLGFFLTMSRLPVRRWLFYCMLASYAVMIELAQFYFPPRTVELFDLLENCLGLAAGVAAAHLASTWLQRRRSAPVETPGEGGA